MPSDLGSYNPDCPGCRDLLSHLRGLEEALAQQGQLLASLQQQVEELKQQAHRQAAPFRTPEAKRKDKY